MDEWIDKIERQTGCGGKVVRRGEMISVVDFWDLARVPFWQFLTAFSS